MARQVIDIPTTGIDFKRHKLFTDAQYNRLQINGIMHKFDHDAIPCVYLMGKKREYLLSEICADRPGMVYGLYYNLVDKPKLCFINLESIYKYHEAEDFLFNERAYRTAYRISVFKKVADELGTLISDEVFFEDIFEKYNLD